METMFETFGMTGAFIGVVWFLLRSREANDKRRDVEANEREERLSSRLGELEDYQKGQLTELVTNTTTVVVDSTSALREFSKAVQTRPCLVMDGNPETEGD